MPKKRRKDMYRKKRIVSIVFMFFLMLFAQQIPLKSEGLPGKGNISKESPNLVINGGAEEGTTGWTFKTISSTPLPEVTGTISNNNFASGKHAFHISRKTTLKNMVVWEQSINSVEPNTKYVFSCKAKGKGELGFGMGAVVSFRNAKNQWIGKTVQILIMQHRNDHPEWDKNAHGLNKFTFFSKEFITPPEVQRMVVWLASSSGSKGDAWWDDVKLIKLGNINTLLEAAPGRI
jgi:hypothetical protein